MEQGKKFVCIDGYYESVSKYFWNKNKKLLLLRGDILEFQKENVDLSGAITYVFTVLEGWRPGLVLAFSAEEVDMYLDYLVFPTKQLSKVL